MRRSARLSEAGRDARRSPRATEAGSQRPDGRSPVRTCVGCRRRDDRSGLLRLVVDPGAAPPSSVVVVVPDPRSRLPGRGAWVHPVTECLDLAEKRRAVSRALRVQGAAGGVDLTRVREHLATGTAGSTTAVTSTSTE